MRKRRFPIFPLEIALDDNWITDEKQWSLEELPNVQGERNSVVTKLREIAVFHCESNAAANNVISQREVSSKSRERKLRFASTLLSCPKKKKEKKK